MTAVYPDVEESDPLTVDALEPGEGFN